MLVSLREMKENGVAGAMQRIQEALEMGFSLFGVWFLEFVPLVVLPGNGVDLAFNFSNLFVLFSVINLWFFFSSARLRYVFGKILAEWFFDSFGVEDILISGSKVSFE